MKNSTVTLVEHCLLEAREILRKRSESASVQKWAGLLEEFVAGGEAYLQSKRSGDGFVLRYTLVCAQGCDSVASICREIDHSEALQLERFCRLCENFLEREFKASLENRDHFSDVAAEILMAKAC
ncbi:MAG: hypothetical protein HKO57_08595 [Akkermansiaceae bacterium]|nr:hypothetical protein [Akkermansiaceae bacterium]